jgi:hypothetical protein
MRQIRAKLDRIATLAALRLLAWVARRIEPEQQLWLEALRAELDAIDGGIARFLWAAGGLRLVWFDRRRHMVNATYRYGPVLLPWLEVALFIGLTRSLIQQYGSLIVILLVLAGLGLLLVLAGPGLILALPLLIAVGKNIRGTGATKRVALPEPESRAMIPLPFALSVISLTTLLFLWLSAPFVLNQMLDQQGLATAGVVVSSADHQTAEAVFNQAGSFSPAEVYLTTQVKPLAVNGVPLAQLRPQADDLQGLVDELTGIQGYNLAHGQFLDAAGMGFDSGLGSTGSGYSGTGIGPRGRLLDAHDAGTFNVLIQRDGDGPFNGDTITVQSLVTGQTFGLNVVGEYSTNSSGTQALFGKVLADESVVQALSGDHPSYAYGLHVDGNQIPTVFERLHTCIPTAQLYNFLTGPTGSNAWPAYVLFNQPGGSIGDTTVPPSPFFVAIPGLWAVLFAAIIVLNWETRRVIKRNGL